MRSKFHESIPPPLSDDEFLYCLRDVHVNTPFGFPSVQNNEVESTFISLKDNKSHLSTYPNKI